MRQNEIATVQWAGITHLIEYARLIELVKAGGNALRNLLDNMETDIIADQEQADLLTTTRAADALLERLCPPSPDDDGLPF
jgi:hypothetical protein